MFASHVWINFFFVVEISPWSLSAISQKINEFDQNTVSFVDSFAILTFENHFTTFELDSDCLSSFFMKVILFWKSLRGTTGKFFHKKKGSFEHWKWI